MNSAKPPQGIPNISRVSAPFDACDYPIISISAEWANPKVCACLSRSSLSLMLSTGDRDGRKNLQPTETPFFIEFRFLPGKGKVTDRLDLGDLILNGSHLLL